MARQKSKDGDSGDSPLIQLERKYGLGKPLITKSEVVSTGSIRLNQAMKIGGTPLGKMIEIIGMESSGKTTLTLHQMAEYQKAFPEKSVFLFDYENSYDEIYAKSIGVDIDKLVIYQPTTQEQGYDMIIGLLEKKLASCIVIDSQSAAPPKAILEGEMDDSTIGLQARLNSKFCMKVKSLLTSAQCTLFVISQLRDSIGSMESTTTTGGKAFRFYSDVRWKLWKTAKKDDEINITTIDVIKSKVDKPFGQAKINIIWGKGFDKMGEIFEYAVEFGFIKKGGAGWYTIGENDMKIQGDVALKEYYDENPEEYEQLKTKVLNKINGNETEM